MVDPSRRYVPYRLVSLSDEFFVINKNTVASTLEYIEEYMIESQENINAVTAKEGSYFTPSELLQQFIDLYEE
ncbi:hypothetical protein CHS0354_014914, partial [Potamilus streckersoni]